ncbi:MAG: DUF305 domain-containing protein [Acidobacteriota bacterium]|nr:DUF305 domain-containing protein [Acidobacteriota bacterium]
MSRHPIPALLAATWSVAVAVCVAPAVGQKEAPIIQPGAPGEPSRQISVEEASDLAGLKYTEADVKFMQGMISHHAQALTMTGLVEARTASEDLRTLAKRIELSQADEIEMMQEWLQTHDQEVTSVKAHHAHDAVLMPGMLTDEEMASLEAAELVEFERRFLELMIAHHQGALVMVDDLLAKRGSAQESVIFGFTSDITADQTMEIDRMAGMLAGLSTDLRVGLAAGFRDAGEAALHLELVAALPKPPGFFSPDAPEGIAIPTLEGEDLPGTEPDEDADDGDEEGDEEGDEVADEGDEEDEEEAESGRARRSRVAAVLNFSNSDLAFSGKHLIQGNFHGFNTYDIEDPALPQLLSSVVCPGGQGDVSIVGDLLILSVEQTRGRLDCGLQGVAEPNSEARFRGIRIFSISDLIVPRQVAAVQTCRGSHTHTVVTDPDDDGNIYVYGSGTSSVRPSEELDGCSSEHPGEDADTALFSIDVIQIPVANPKAARIVNRPRIFADPDSGAIAGLWKGGDHGTGTQKTSKTNQCHDITVFPQVGLAAGACSGNGILLDISDPTEPVRLDQATDPGFAYWHSATFNQDGTKVVFTDEWGGGMRPRCRASDPRQWGANAIFDIVDRKLKLRSHYKLPAPQSKFENCVAHNGSLVPVPGRDVMAQAWYQGGISVFDFTDSSQPFEIAYFDRGPIDAEKLKMGGHWSAYWHNGHIFGAEIARGLDVLRLLPSEHLSQNEIDAASLIGGEIVNAQHQRRIDWPPLPVVARAYIDQLVRGDVLEDTTVVAVTRVLEAAERGSDGARTATEIDDLVAALADVEASGRDRAHLEALANTMSGIAADLR